MNNTYFLNVNHSLNELTCWWVNPLFRTSISSRRITPWRTKKQYRVPSHVRIFTRVRDRPPRSRMPNACAAQAQLIEAHARESRALISSAMLLLLLLLPLLRSRSLCLGIVGRSRAPSDFMHMYMLQCVCVCVYCSHGTHQDCGARAIRIHTDGIIQRDRGRSTIAVAEHNIFIRLTAGMRVHF